jgi:hypothetical protein
MVVAQNVPLAASLTCDTTPPSSSNHGTERLNRNLSCSSRRPQYRLHYSDDHVKSRCEAILRTTLLLAQGDNDNSSNAMLAQKAMKYRKKQFVALNYDETSLDIFQSLGIVWCKVTPAQAP